jgi:hypothetical protein
MSFWEQAYSKACAQTGSLALRAGFMSGPAELVLPGVVKWVPLSVRTVGTVVVFNKDNSHRHRSRDRPRGLRLFFYNPREQSRNNPARRPRQSPRIWTATENVTTCPEPENAQ